MSDVNDGGGVVRESKKFGAVSRTMAAQTRVTFKSRKLFTIPQKQTLYEDEPRETCQTCGQ